MRRSNKIKKIGKRVRDTRAFVTKIHICVTNKMILVALHSYVHITSAAFVLHKWCLKHCIYKIENKRDASISA